MRILYISQYFPPEMGAPAARVHEISRAWAAAGHSVTVLTAFPHHPTGVIPPEYRGKVLMRESVDGIDLLRTWVYATPNEGFLKRILSYLSFMCSAVLLGLPSLSGRYDVVIATSPQFFVAVAGFLISTLLRLPFVFEVRDLWPASIVAVGALKSPSLIRALETVEMTLYRRARLIVAVADSTVDILHSRGIPRRKIAVIKNGVDLDMFTPLPTDHDLRKELSLDDKFICTYIGTIGMAHALDVVLEAASLARDDPSLAFLLVGTGARHRELESRAKEMSLTNVVFAGRRPRDLVPRYLAASDAVLVHLKKIPLFEHVIPSKLFEIMAAARPIVLGVSGEAASLITDASSGIITEPENAAELLSAVEKLRSDPALADSLGKSGRAFVTAHFNRDTLAADYLTLLAPLAGTP